MLTGHEKYFIQILGINFLIGFILVLFICFFKPDLRRSLVIKYIVYLLLVVLCSVLIISDMQPWFMICLLLGGWIELRTTVENISRFKKIMGFLIYLSVCSGMIYFMNDQRSVVFHFYALVVLFDGYSQLTGQLIGRTKLAAKTSPGKTIEGFLGGWIALTLALLFLPGLNENTIWFYILSSSWIACSALIGDLLASKWKRLAGLKDFNNLLPGHGGILDRFDGFIGACGFTGIALMLMKFYS